MIVDSLKTRRTSGSDCTPLRSKTTLPIAVFALAATSAPTRGVLLARQAVLRAAPAALARMATSSGNFKPKPSPSEIAAAPTPEPALSTTAAAPEAAPAAAPAAAAAAAPKATPAKSSVEVDEPDVIFRAAGKFLCESALREGAHGSAGTVSARPKLSVLDAGTGKSSLSWLLRSRWVGSWAAVTASAAMEKDVTDTLAAARASLPPGSGSELPPGRVIRCTWDDPLLLNGGGASPLKSATPLRPEVGAVGSAGRGDVGAAGLAETFDVVLADYLLGSIDGFTPYRQDVLIDRLLPHLKPDGTLVIIGLEPIPNAERPPYDVVPLCARLRDAVFLHAGQRPYREYPLSWVLRALARSHMEPVLVRRFPIIYAAKDLIKELNTARSRLPTVESRSGKAFAAALRLHIDEVEARVRATLEAQPGGTLSYGEDYLCCARRIARPVAVAVEPAA